MLMIDGTHDNLGKIVRTHLEVESLSERRITLIQVIAMGGGLIWLGLIDPRVLPRSIMTLAEIGVPLLVAALIHSLFLELTARAQLARLLRNRTPDETASEPPPSSFPV